MTLTKPEKRIIKALKSKRGNFIFHNFNTNIVMDRDLNKVLIFYSKTWKRLKSKNILRGYWPKYYLN